MSTVSYRANLTAASFPFVSGEVGRTVIIKQHDQNYIPTVASKADDDKDAGIPRAYYMHNVMPTDSGYQTVSYLSQIAAAVGKVFSDVSFHVSSTGKKVLLGFLADGNLMQCSEDSSYTWQDVPVPKKLTFTFTGTGNGTLVDFELDSSAVNGNYTITFSSSTAFSVSHSVSGAQGSGTVGTTFTSTDTFLTFYVEAGTTAFTAGAIFTIAVANAVLSSDTLYSSVYMQGEVYVCLSGIGIFKYDFASSKLLALNVLGLDLDNIVGIAAAQGYLVAYAPDSAGWSSLTNAVDFTPSLITGAGGGSIEGARGPLRRIISSANGMYIFTAQNAVSAVFSQNTRYPFIFTNIANCGGLTDVSMATEEADDSALYAFTTQGLQNISLKKAVAGFPEAADFLTGQFFEDFNTATLSFEYTVLTAPLKRKLAFISGRYLVISYGISSFTHAIVYDAALKRWGKLKQDHVAAFEYGFFDADTADASKRQLAFLTASGEVSTVDFSASRAVGDSVLVLGKYQLLRSRTAQLLEVSIDGADVTDTISVYDLPSIRGHVFESPVEGYTADQGVLGKAFNFRTTAVNHTLALLGKYKISSLQLMIGVGGNR